MEYEVFEPDPDDEYYDQLVTDAFVRMFSEGWDFDVRDPVCEQ